MDGLTWLRTRTWGTQRTRGGRGGVPPCTWPFPRALCPSRSSLPGASLLDLVRKMSMVIGFIFFRRRDPRDKTVVPPISDSDEMQLHFPPSPGPPPCLGGTGSCDQPDWCDWPLLCEWGGGGRVVTAMGGVDSKACLCNEGTGASTNASCLLSLLEFSTAAIASLQPTCVAMDHR